MCAISGTDEAKYMLALLDLHSILTHLSRFEKMQASKFFSEVVLMLLYVL